MTDSLVLGDVIQVHGVAGSVTITLSRPVYRVEPFPPSRSWPGVEQARAQPSRLLLARYEVVPFTGRESLQRELADWMQGPAGSMSVRLVHGPGGQGKTRLAAFLAGEHANGERGWQVWQAREALPSSAVPSRLSMPAGAARVLVVVDYADRWAFTHLQALLSDLRTLAVRMPGGPTVRVLLLARSAGWWWQGLQEWLDADLDLPAEQVPLQPLGGEVDRYELFTAARDRFAAALEVAGCQAIDPPARLGDVRFAQVLSVHMAALAAVDAHHRGTTAPVDPERISAYLLRRERAHWQAWHSRHDDPLPTPPPTMGRAVWAATLTGPLPHLTGIAVLERAQIATLPENAAQVLADHQRCYPADDPATVLEPLYPDRLGEDFLALSIPGNTAAGCDTSAVDAWAGTALLPLLTPASGEEQPPPWTRAALTVLIETARRWPHVASRQLYPLLTAHPEHMLYAGSAALAALADLPDIDLALLEAVEALLPPGRHIDLDLGIAALSTRLTDHRLTATTDPARKAALHLNHANRLGNAGQHQPALEAGQRALKLYGELAESNRDAYLPNLAMSLSNHAVGLAAVGRRAEAVPISEQAVELRRELAELNRDAYLPDLAMSLSNHAVRLAEVGRRAEAVPVSEQAIELHGELAEHNRDTYLSNLATSLSNHAALLAEVGRVAEAVPIAEQAVELHGELAEHKRDAYLPDLAMSLSNHANRLAEVGRIAEAVPISEQAVELRRELAELNRDAYLPDLAASLNNHAVQLAEVGRVAEAVPISEQAIELYGELAELNRDAYLPNLATSLSNYANRLAEVGRIAEAVPVSEQAVELRRELAELNRDAYLPDLTMSLSNHAVRLAEVGRRAEAVPVSEQAVELYGELAELNRDAYLPNLAGSLNNHAALLAEVGRIAEAVPVSEQAVDLYGELAEHNPDAYLPNYVRSLAVQGRTLSQAQRHGEAVVPLVEALAIGLELPEYARDLVGAAAEVLHEVYRAGPQEVSETFETLTGQPLPDWIKE
ncbi:tetratricopeptide repeat protein [Nonomuraea sp. NPDC049028]|uniref:tetratricopeptide repeat protein n=1 Tax=Nonomuraea sp. NPDC049028 TaxID=3364348 RepID=UPI00371A9326